MRSQKWLTFFLPAFLILLPLVMLGFRANLDREKNVGSPRYRERMDALARHLHQMSTMEFWAEETARRFRQTLLRSWTARPEWPREKLLARALQRSRMGKIPAGMFWLVRFPEPQSRGKSRLVQSPGLSNLSETMIRNLLEQAWLAETGREHALDTPRWVTTIKNLFGLFITPDFFSATFRGRAFPVIFQGQFRWMVWDFLVPPGEQEPRAAFAMCLEAPRERLSEIIVPTILQEWGYHDVLPAFLSFPFEPGGARVQRRCHPQLNVDRAAPVLAEVQEQMEIVLPTGTQHLVGDLRLPFRLVGQTHAQGTWGYQVVPLGCFQDCCGVLMAPLVAPAPGWVEKIPQWYALVAVFLLSLYGFRWWCLGKTPDLPVREQLFSWLLGLILAPWLLAMVVGAQFLGDLRENLIDAEAQNLEIALSQIDSGIGSLLGASEKACRETLAAPNLVERLKGVQLRNEDAEPILQELVSRAQTAGLQLRCALIMGHGGFRKSWIQSGMSPQQSDLLLDFAEIGYGRRFHDFPSPSPVFKKQEYTLKVKTALARRANSPNTLLNYESTDRFWVGDKAHSSFVWRGFSDKMVWYLVILVWDQTGENMRFLSQKLKSENSRQSDVQFAAFQEVIQKWQPVAGSAARPEFLALRPEGNALKKQRVFGLGAEASLVQAQSSQRLPGVVFFARTPLREVWIRIVQEVLIIFALLVGSIGLVLGTAVMLARHISGPIVRISLALDRVAQGDLDTLLSVENTRWDELGEAERELETLTGKLRERRALLSFVSPQVLESLTGGNMLELARGRSREATVLASDIRDFTPMTESCEPRVVFDLVNRHLQKMAEVIQRHGGVIDRFVGDAVFAVFYSGAVQQPAASALEAAREMMLVHDDLVRERQTKGLLPYRIGIGIETGRLLTGILGDSESRLDFTVLGEIVNRAAELENASKAGRYSRIVVSEGLRDQLTATFAFSPVDGCPEAWELIESAGRPLFLSASEMDSGAGEASKSQENSDGSGALPEVPRTVSESDSVPVALVETFSWPIVLTIILLFGLSLGVAFYSWVERARGGELSRARQLLQRASNQISGERILVHEIQKSLREISAPLMVSESPEAGKLARFQERLRRLFEASPKWQYQLSLFPPAPAGLSGNDPGGMLVGGAMKTIAAEFRGPASAQPFYLVEDVENLVFLAQAFVLRRFAEQVPFSPALAKWKVTQFDTRGFKAKDFGEVLGRCTNNISWEVNASQMVGMGCFPIYDPEPLDILPGAGASVAAELQDEQWLNERIARTRKSLKGVLMVFLDHGAARLEHLLPMLIDDFRAEGFELEVIREGESPEALCRNPVFRSDLHLQQIIQNSPSSVVETGPWLVVQEVVHQDRSYRVFLAKRQGGGWWPFSHGNSSAGSPEASGPAASSSERTMVSGTLAYQLGDYSFWLCFLAGFLPMFVVGRMGIQRFFRTRSLPLRHQLTAHFLVAVMPVLFMGWQMLERARHEGEGRLASEARVKLQEKVQRVDASMELFDSFCSALVEYEMTLASGADQLSLLLEKGKDYLEEWVTRAEATERRFGERGLLLMDITILHPEVGAWKSPFNQPLADLQKATMVQRFAFRDLSHRIRADQGLAPGAGNREKGLSEDLVLGAELDEFLKGIGVGLDPVTLARFLLSPAFFSTWASGQTDVRTVTTRMVWRGNLPIAEAQLTWKTPNPEVPMYSSWLRDGEVDENGIRLMPMRVSDSQTRLVAPFLLRPPMYRGSRQELRWIVRDLNSDQQNLAALVADSGQPLLEVQGSGATECLRLAFPTVKLPKGLFLAEYPLGKKRMEFWHQYYLQEWALLGLMVLALFLARRAAHRFLEPVSRLNQALRRVQQGDFSQKLPTCWGAEFDTLARSFNAMTASAEEGRILGKFVSGSALAIVGSGKLSDDVKAGTQQNAVVLFVQLSGFKELLKKRHPEWVVEKLNQYFETLSRVIRSHGGEIDKFIGEKILAVFRDEESTEAVSPPTRFERAMKAARGMRSEFQAHARDMGVEIGIGVVSGPVLAGVMGTPSVRLEFTIIGDTVNLASRLCDVAGRLPDGGIVVEQALVKALQARPDWSGEFVALPVKTVKGKRREVEVFQLKL